MLDDLIAAFERQDYKTAARLVKQLLHQSPRDPWGLLYAGKLQEVSRKWDLAEKAYRKLLRDTTNPKIAMQARQGLERLETLAKERRRDAIAQATSDAGSMGTGFLILESVPTERRTETAQKLAQIMKLDPYTARLQIPSRGWRLYRTGAIGELQLYKQELLSAGIPTFCFPLDAIQKIHVFRVQYLQRVSPQPTIVCQNEVGQMGSLSFNWSEVTQCVKGLLPIFEDVVDVGVWNKLKWKEQTQDYAQVYDLHIPDRQCIIRLCDNTYEFQKGVIFQGDAPSDQGLTQTTTRINWNHLVEFFDQTLNKPVWSDFTPFAETALDQLDLVDNLDAHINLLRKAETTWDPAFHLYSSLVFLHELS